MKPVACDFRARRQRRQCENAHHDHALELESAAAGDVGYGKCRVGRQRSLHQRRLGNAELAVGGLQIAIVQKRDLHGGIGSERPLEQTPDRASGRFGIVGRAQRHDILAELGAGNVRYHSHAAIGREPRTAREQGGEADRHARKRRSPARMWHGVPHGFGAGALRSFWSCHDDGSTGRRLS